MSLEEEWTKREVQESDNAIPHRPLVEENGFYHAVCSGDIAFIEQNCAEQAFTNPEGMGTLSTNALRNIRYHFVITTAMITRHCVNAGLEMEQAYRLSDFYILKMDSYQTITDIARLHDEMILDFTRRMLMFKKRDAISKPIVQCTEYIYNNINSRVTIEDLADFTNLSTSYLSRLFKKELGISVSEYIRNKKIEKAQNLLKYSDYTQIEIANYLSFSSQSHFIQTFRSVVGMTPKKYRDHFYRTSW